MWQRNNYEEAAQKIGKEFAENRGNNTVSINQLATKVARDNNLNPEGIRTMVRLANVAVFEEVFHKQAGATDRMFEFEVGDPEVVINTLFQETKTAMDKVAAAPCGYDFGADYYGDLEAPVQKVAEAPVEEVAAYISPMAVKQRMIQAQEKLAMEKQEHEFEWVEALEKAAKLMMVAAPSIPACVTFEKDALSMLGDGAVPEITVLRQMTGRCTKHAFLGGVPVTEVLEKHVSNPSTETRGIIQMLKTAQEARSQMSVCQQGLEWLAQNASRVK
jgi:hypothetical protein